jgi:hypothetical protein
VAAAANEPKGQQHVLRAETQVRVSLFVSLNDPF